MKVVLDLPSYVAILFSSVIMMLLILHMQVYVPVDRFFTIDKSAEHHVSSTDLHEDRDAPLIGYKKFTIHIAFFMLLLGLSYQLWAPFFEQNRGK